MEDNNLVLLIGPDDFPTCPVDGQRMETVMVKPDGRWQPKVVDTDEDGPIFEARCKVHGAYRFQVIEDEEGE